MDPSSDTRNINLGPNQMALKDHSKVKKKLKSLKSRRQKRLDPLLYNASYLSKQIKAQIEQYHVLADHWVRS
jgi:hypothetical protein